MILAFGRNRTEVRGTSAGFSIRKSIPRGGTKSRRVKRKEVFLGLHYGIGWHDHIDITRATDTCQLSFLLRFVGVFVCYKL